MLFIYVFNGSRIPLLVSFLLLFYKPLGLLLKVDFVLDNYAKSVLQRTKFSLVAAFVKAININTCARVTQIKDNNSNEQISIPSVDVD